MTRIIKYLFYAITIYCCQLTLPAQQNKIDSLLTLLKSTKEDTTKVNIFNNLFLEYEFSDDEKALEYLNKAFNLSQKIVSKKSLATTYIYLGYFAEDKGDYPEALKNYFVSLKIMKSVDDKKGIANAYNNIGLVYSHQGNYPEAFKNCFAALKIRETINDKKGIADSHQSIGMFYSRQNNYDEALKNFFAALKIYQEIGNNKGVAYSYNNIGLVYQNQGNYIEALNNYNASLKIHENLNNKPGIALVYSNIGFNYVCQMNYSEALKIHFMALKIREALGDRAGVVDSYFNIAANFLRLKQYKEAENYLFRAKELGKEIGKKLVLSLTYQLFSELDSAKGNFEEAYENYKLHILYRDSVDNEDTRKKTIQNQMTYDFEKKEAATQAEQDKKDVIAKEELKQKEQQRNYFVIGFALVGLLALFILRGYKQKQKANFIITQQKNEVEKSKHIIEEKNKDITDSINYAKRIQRATLPHRKEIWEAFPQSFVLFKPKDIVSGDFYFFNKNDHSTFIAAADCTGHGVPGAFMSMIGAGKLNDAVSESSDTSEILLLLNKGIKSSLKQSDGNESTRDGMDIALCSVDTKSRIVKYAGANRPLWIIRNGLAEVEEIKATKNAIGGLTDSNQHFLTHELKLRQGDTFYICTDGFADQFNGHSGKKLMTKKFKEILLDIQGKSMKEQEQYLNSFIENWKAGTEQVDDILVIGIRL